MVFVGCLFEPPTPTILFTHVRVQQQLVGSQSLVWWTKIVAVEGNYKKLLTSGPVKTFDSKATSNTFTKYELIDISRKNQNPGRVGMIFMVAFPLKCDHLNHPDFAPLLYF